MNHAQQKQKKRFVLTMRNQKGQVGIFVALIFQVVFVFFAMLVNVGLVVHHKINLQQSTDLAAYYGAMKQAEIMNVMAHVNFQMRQAWKLMSWRYRVLGTFGLEQNNNSFGLPPGQSRIPIEFPVKWPTVSGVKRPSYNPASRNFACSGAGPRTEGITITDVPFMCMGHDGFGDWISAEGSAGTGDETFCKIDCRGIESSKAFSISDIPPVNTIPIWGNSLGGTINSAITTANKNVEEVCNKLGPVTAQLLALFYGNYIKDTGNRRLFIRMMAKNLGLDEKKMLDIEGNSVFTGVENTLKNNLTEANFAGLDQIVPLNGVKAFGGNSFADGMMREITFKRLLFFLVDCKYISGSQKDIMLKPLYQGNTNSMDTHVFEQLRLMMGSEAAARNIEAIFSLNDEKNNTIGFEKNPYIQVYYGVKASSTPRIPFLPLAKVKLHAVAFAKPFGGTIGPWYFKTWEPGDEDNDGRFDWENRTDPNLPFRDTDTISADPTLKEAREFFFNYSTHVGDVFSNDAAAPDVGNKGGLANTDIVALYHNMLANKRTHQPGSYNTNVSTNKADETNAETYQKPKKWPMYNFWYHLAAQPGEDEFDPLAVDRNGGSPRNSYMRDIELTVVSPNQFDATYYSIEPDFHTNYVLKIQPNIAKFAAETGIGTAPIMPLDYGNPGKNPVTGVGNNFPINVRAQIQVTNELFKKAWSDIVSLGGNTRQEMRFGLDVLATRQASVLTGWTFLDLTQDPTASYQGYATFPSPTRGGPFSMLFGTCNSDAKLNPWSETYGAPYDFDSKLPPVPGNCVTGGRTGYSVKLISSDILRNDPSRTFENIGGPNKTGRILNPIPDDFLQF